MTERVAVALSGGADSALAASLLLSSGVNVFGLHLLLTHTIEAELQAAHARDIALRLHMDFQVIDAVDAFESKVIGPFCDEYAAGRTPNPCVTCNRDIKFGLLLQTALECGADRLATGHYARVTPRGNGYALQRASDQHADQSYFLYALPESALAHLSFPLGDLLRRDVRSLAAEQGLIRSRSSQDICFVGGHDYREFLSRRLSTSQGDIIGADGRILGQHRGLPFVTIGQRHGLGIALGAAVYVVGVDARLNSVTVGSEEQLMSEAAHLEGMSWLIPPQADRFRAEALVRFRSSPTNVRVALTEGGATVQFTQPQRAVAPGQSVVLYDGATVIGGGIVSKTFRRVSDAE